MVSAGMGKPDPVILACFVEDLISGFPGTALTQVPRVVQQYVPQLLPDITNFTLHAISVDQQYQCVWMLYSAQGCNWATEAPQAIISDSTLAQAVSGRGSQQKHLTLTMPIIVGSKVAAVVCFHSQTHLDEVEVLWAQAFTRVLWVCLKINMPSQE